jgi:hypothetical protein
VGILRMNRYRLTIRYRILLTQRAVVKLTVQTVRRMGGKQL